MNGFKDGAADDAFSEASEEDETGRGEASKTTDHDGADSAEQSTGLDETSEPAVSASTGLPWIYERTSITDGREKTVQLHLQSSTLDEQRDALAETEKLLGESVKKADLREAALLVGFQHLDEVAGELREWGYDIE